MLSINYPKKYQDETSRIGKKFKYFKIEPIEMEKKEEPKEVKIGRGSGRIAALKSLKENVLAESYSDIIDDYLMELNNGS